MIPIEKISTPIGIIALILLLVFTVLFRSGSPAWWRVCTFVLASISLVVMFIITYNNKNTDVNKNTDGKSTCESLKGNYKFHSRYVYIEKKDDIKGTAIDANWIATTCKKNEDNTYSLNGEDKSTHLVEVFMNGVYQEVATVVSPYKSTIIIGSDGVLQRRIITSPSEITPDMVRRNKDKFNVNTEKLITVKINDYIGIIEDKHNKVNTCFPVLYEDKPNKKTFIVLICQDYVRTLVKQD
jgi:hypothetical protein